VDYSSILGNEQASLFHFLDSRLRDCFGMSLRGKVTTETISYLIDIIEIATFTVVNSQ
jgi:hypothetical protein